MVDTYNENTPKITIYTQAYNTEKYISECIESVLTQTYPNFEYFICNHGSTDGTLDIIKQYAAKDSRIHVFEKSNSNRGFLPELIKEYGRGKYFTMLDSDDYWSPDYLEILVPFAERNQLDMAICGYYSFFEATGKLSPSYEYKKEVIYHISENSKYFSQIYPFLQPLWGRLIHMDILKKADYSVYRLNAPDYVSEDTAFTLANYEQCQRIGLSPHYLLYYRYRAGSVTTKYYPALIDNNRNILLFAYSMLNRLGDCYDKSLYAVSLQYLYSSLSYTWYRLSISDTPLTERLAEIRRALSQDTIEYFLDTRPALVYKQLTTMLHWLSHQLFENRISSPEDITNCQYIISTLLPKIQQTTC